MLDFVYEQLSARVERVKQLAPATRLAPEAEAIHQLRVSIRRLREATRSLEEWVKAKAAGKLRDRLRPVMKAAGAVRNLDIACELCRDSGVASAAGVATALQAARVKAAHVLIEDLLLLRLDKLRPPCDPDPGVPGPQVLATAILPDLVLQYWRAGDKAALPEADWTDLHGFRIATKHLRYTIELFAPAYGRAAQARLEVLKRVQTHLGNVNDCHTARALDAIRGDAALDEWLAARQHAEREKFVKDWAQERLRSGAGAVWVRYFQRPPRSPEAP